MNRVRLAGCIVLTMILQGCLFSPRSIMPTKADIASQELSFIDDHLSLMHDITSGNYQQQLDLFTSVVNQREVDASAHNRLREALALITTGHPNSDPGRGYSELKTLMEQSTKLTALERRLATVILNETENVMILEARNSELSAAISNSQTVLDQKGTSNRESLSQARKQLDAAQQEIDVLQIELEEARAKLDAIKRIEVTSE